MMFVYVLVFLALLSLVVALNATDNSTFHMWPLDSDSKAIHFTYANGENTYSFMGYPGATSYIAETLGANGRIKDADDNFSKTKVVVPKNTFNVVTNNAENFLRITAVTPKGNVAIQLAPCFLAGSMVQMFDGTQKPIENVAVGDDVQGAFGERNFVLGLHRPLLGEHKMCRVNDEHTTTNHHPHVGADRGFFCGDPQLVSTATYNKSHEVIGPNGPERMFLAGLNPQRIRKLEVGVHLQTLQGAKPVASLHVFSMPPDTQLYNLVVSHSHTYFVEGYAVTGWPREDDFDYDSWTSLNANSTKA